LMNGAGGQQPNGNQPARNPNDQASKFEKKKDDQGASKQEGQQGDQRANKQEGQQDDPQTSRPTEKRDKQTSQSPGKSQQVRTPETEHGLHPPDETGNKNQKPKPTDDPPPKKHDKSGPSGQSIQKPNKRQEQNGILTTFKKLGRKLRNVVNPD